MKPASILLASSVLMLLAGCGEANFDDLQARMDEIKSRPKGRIEPPPEFKAYKAFTYSAAVLRSPFDRPIEVELAVLPKKRSDIVPDFSRAKEHLEQFGIDSLTMVGTLMKPGNELYALVRDPESGLHRVAQGQFLGRNFGRITGITPNKIDVIEIVSDGQDGWVERPRTLVLNVE